MSERPLRAPPPTRSSRGSLASTSSRPQLSHLPPRHHRTSASAYSTTARWFHHASASAPVEMTSLHQPPRCICTRSSDRDCSAGSLLDQTSASSCPSPSPLADALTASPLSRDTSIPSPYMAGSAPSSPASTSLSSYVLPLSGMTALCSPSSSSSSFSSASATSLCSSSPVQYPFRRCKLCNYSSAIDPAQSHTCTRCGLTTPPLCADFELDSCPGWESQSESSSIMAAAATAYRFQLLSRMSPLLSDLSRIVIDYLIWYRLPTDFHVDDLVDVQDVRGVWMPGRVKEVEGDEVLLAYAGCSSKWDQWIAVHSELLAPYRTKTQHWQSTAQLPADSAAADKERIKDGSGEADSRDGLHLDPMQHTY